MPTIFTIDGAELGAYSSGVASLQTALIALGRKVGDSTLAVLVLDGLIGPKTTAATNIAFTRYVSGAPGTFATGLLTQAQVTANATALANYVSAEVARRGGAVVAVKAPATVVSTIPTPAPSAQVSDTSTQIVKWSAIGLGGVVVASILYYLWKMRSGRPAFGDFGMKGNRINDHERELWVNNDEGLYRWYQSERRQPGGLRAFIKRHRDEIDAAIRGVRDAPPRSSFGADWKPYSHREATKMAQDQWDALWSIEEVNTPPGTVIRRTTGPLAKHHGAPIAQQFKVRLHSNTGPLHWIVIREDGTPMFDGGRCRS